MAGVNVLRLGRSQEVRLYACHLPGYEFVLVRSATYCVLSVTGNCGEVKMRKAYLLLLTAAILILFSGSWVLSKEVVGSVSPVLATGVRLLFTTTVLWLWVFCSEGRRGSFHLRRGRAVRFAVLSIFGFSAYFISTFEALKDLKASELTMLLSSIPGFTYVLGVLFGVLSFSWLRFFGVLVVTLGGVMFNVSPGAGFGGVQGIAFAFLGALSYSVYGLLSRVWLERDSIVVSVAWITLMSFVSFIPFVLAHHDSLMGLAMDDFVKLFVLGVRLQCTCYIKRCFLLEGLSMPIL